MTMAMKLNGWQRIGIIISVLWIIGGGFWGLNADIKRAVAYSDKVYSSCVEYDERPRQECSKESWNAETAVRQDQGFMLPMVLAFAPVIAGWILAYIGVYSIKWVRAGFKRDQL